MKINSADDICWISIRPNTDSKRYSGFEVFAHVDIGHGQFNAKNSDVNFFNFGAFVDEFDAFIMDRHRCPRLEGTYETYLAFIAAGTRVICEYRLGDVFSGSETAFFSQTGRFELDHERLLEYLHGFHKLAAQQHI